MHILLTRPLEDCSHMIIKFQSLGHKVSHLQLLSVNKIHHPKINFLEYNAIIFSSANALKFLEFDQIDKNMKCFCVGDATEKKARSLGFQNTISAEGNIVNLKELILRNFEKNEGKIIYVSGEIISSELDKELQGKGYNIKRLINYQTKHVEKFNETFVNELSLNIPDIVYVYSQNSALSFLKFIKINRLENHWMNTNLMCIGEKTSTILNEIKWKKIFLFNPGEEEFLLYKI